MALQAALGGYVLSAACRAPRAGLGRYLGAPQTPLISRDYLDAGRSMPGLWRARNLAPVLRANLGDGAIVRPMTGV